MVITALVGALILPSGACGSDDGATSSDSAGPGATAQDFSGRGAYDVGATRLELDADRPVEVFYPADPEATPADADPYRFTTQEVWGSLADALPEGAVTSPEMPVAWFDVPASVDGPFPLVVLSHGFSMMRFTFVHHAAQLASWGYVVAVPEHPTRDLQAMLGGVDIREWQGEPDTILDTIDLMEAENARPDATLTDRVAMDQVAVEGHSAGGHDAAISAYDDRVDTWIGLAPAVPFPEGETGAVEFERADGFDRAAGEFDLAAHFERTAPPEKPSMMLVADGDVALPLPDRRLEYEWLPAPKRFVVLADTGHSVFLIDCVGIQERGGSALADALGFDPSTLERRTLENGCTPDDAPASEVTATWSHLVVAQLNLVFDIDPDVAASSLEPEYLDATFPGRIEEYLVEE